MVPWRCADRKGRDTAVFRYWHPTIRPHCRLELWIDTLVQHEGRSASRNRFKVSYGNLNETAPPACSGFFIWMLPTVIEFFLNRKLATRVDDWYNFHRNLSSHWVFILKHMSERVFVPDPPLPTSDHYVYYGLLKLISRHVPMTFALDCFPLGMPLSSVWI